MSSISCRMSVQCPWPHTWTARIQGNTFVLRMSVRKATPPPNTLTNIRFAFSVFFDSLAHYSKSMFENGQNCCISFIVCSGLSQTLWTAALMPFFNSSTVLNCWRESSSKKDDVMSIIIMLLLLVTTNNWFTFDVGKYPNVHHCQIWRPRRVVDWTIQCH